ncbi:putative phospholipid ABC transporter permease protein MlaE [bacterium HR19]|nr:putative phospholipid ABC transporter permease protein MlaE [bacterium HR19]
MIKTIKSFIEYEIKFFKALKGKIFFREILYHTGKFGRMSLFPLLGTCIPFSVIIALHGWEAVALFSAYRFLPSAITIVVLREVAPVISAMIIISIIGNSIASEITLMRIRGEFTYLEVIGVNPFEFVIIPRVIAVISICVMMFIIISTLSVFANFLYLVYIKGLSEGTFRENIWNLISQRDILGGAIKSAIFGLIIGKVSTFLGVISEESTEGVGKAGSLTVITSSLIFIVLNVILSLAIFGGFTPELR